MVFKHYVRLLKDEKSPESALTEAYEDLDSLTDDLLNVLIHDQDHPQYEENFFIIWSQIFKKTIAYLQQYRESNQSMVDLFASQFYSLKSIYQESLYPKFHHILEKQQKLLVTKDPQALIALLKAFLFKGYQDEANMKVAYAFCDGLLCIMKCLIKDQSTNNSVLCKFSSQQIKDLSDILCQFLNQHCNQGVFTGVPGCQVSLVMKLDLSILMSSIINEAQTKDSQSSFEAFVKTDKESLIPVISNLIQWLLLNYFSQKGKSTPSGSRIYQLSQNIETIVNKIAIDDEAVSQCLPVLMKSILTTDYKLRELIQDNKINNQRAVAIQTNVNELFLNFFKTWVHSDQVAKKFLTELNGFDFLLYRLFSKQEESEVKEHVVVEDDDDLPELVENDAEEGEEDTEQDDQIMSMIMQKLNKPQPKKEEKKKEIKDDKVNKLFKKLPTMVKQGGKVDIQDTKEKDAGESSTREVEQKITVNELGKNLKIIWTTDKQKAITSQYGSVQWPNFKNGTKNRIYTHIIPAGSSENYEYVMKFDLTDVIQLHEIQIGMLYNWSTYDADCAFLPQTFILEGGKTEDKADWKIILKPLDDDGYKMNSITVYGHNFVDTQKSNCQSIEQVLDQIGTKECRYLTMKLRRPIMACLDQSMYAACSQKQKSYGISFISVMGTQIIKPTLLYSYLIDLQKENSLEVLSKFFSGQFTEAFELISEQPQIIEKIQNAFDKLAVLLDTKASLIKPIFLAICSKNKDLGDWIMMNRLVSLNSDFIRKEQIIFLGDIISSNREKNLDKLVKLKAFIIEQIGKTIKESRSLTDEQLVLLRRYLKLYNSKLREYSNYVKHNDPAHKDLKIQLDFNTEDLDNVIAFMVESQNDQKLFNALTSFALSMLNPPEPFQNLTISVNDYVEKLLKSDKNQLQNLLFSSIISTTNAQALESILANNKIDWVRQNIKELTSQSDDNEIFSYSQVLYNCSLQTKFRDLYRADLPFELYDTVLKGTAEGKVLRQNLDDDTISLLVQTIKNLIIGGETELEKMSAKLKEDLVKATEVSDVAFINKVIVPILHAERTVPITLSVLNKGELNKGIQPIYASSDASVPKDSFFLKTQLLNKKQKDSLSKMMKEIASPHVDNYPKMMSSKWELIFEDKTHAPQDSSKFRKFVQSVSNKQNVVILCSAKINDQNVIFGGFTNKPFPALGESWAHEFDYQIPFSEANFVFHYTPDKEQHFTMLHNKAFGYIYTDYEEGGALSISGDFFLISWSYEFQNSCGNIYDMKCVEDPSVVSFYHNMQIQSVEIWWSNPNSKADISDGHLKAELKKSQYFKRHSPLNFFRDNLVFEVSDQLTLSHVAQEILGKNAVFVKYPNHDDKLENTLKVQELVEGKNDAILDLVFVKEAAQPTEETKDAIVQAKEDKVEPQVEVKPVELNKPLLKLFETKGGIFDLIKAAKSAVNLYTNEKMKEMWGLWLSELESFSQLPEFFNTFCQDREKETLIYSLLSGENDTKSTDQTQIQSFITSQEELHIEMVKYSYKIVSQVFEKLDSAALRDECLKNGTFERFIERVGQLSSEKKRVKVAPSVSASETSSPEKGKDQMQQKDKKKKKDTIQQDTKKRKGVGYTTGVGTTWNVNEYLKSREAKNGQAANIVNILKNMIRSKDWQAPPEVKGLILESALLPTLESAFRSGSLLEMAKDYELNLAYLGFVEELANHSSLIDLLLDIGDEYEPRQKETVSLLLKKVAELSKIFLDCLPEDQKNKVPDNEEDEKALRPKFLAEKILSTHDIVQAKLKEQSGQTNQLSTADILAMPLQEAYHLLLSDLRFDTMNMKNSSGLYNHAYVADLPKGLNPPVPKLVRLAQEIADLSNSLPCDHTNAIFCRVDKERVDVMKCLIMGASGTPYAHGAFIYDLFFENAYPGVPPKCQLVTTGGQTVRFNPNLYNNGKVCLSLLGTWRGSSTENWDPKLSTILQVLLSIQAIIMSNEVYFNEPGYEHEQGTDEGEKKNEGYANIVRYCNVKFAIIDVIKNPPAGFETIIKRSYYLKKNEILREVQEWVERAKTVPANYTGLVYDHNYTWAPQLSPDGKYAEMMEQIYKELKETLEALPSPFEDEATGKKIERKFSEQESEQDHNEEQADNQDGGQIAKIEDIDVTYDNEMKQNEQIDISDEKVKDRWSRYIGAMGIEAVAKQAESRIMICGLGPLGLEIAKNIVLAGCKELLLYDPNLPQASELSGMFYLDESCLTQSRAKCVADKLQQLNHYVKVTVVEKLDSDPASKLNESYKDLKVLVVTDMQVFSQNDLYCINKTCRTNKTAMILAYQNGVFSKVFNDFGPEFIVLDKDGEETQEVMIEKIEWNEDKNQTQVTLLQGFKHKYQDGDVVKIREVKGMNLKSDESKSINNSEFKIKVISPQQFTLEECDARDYTPYEGNGTARQIKMPVKLQFQTLEEVDAEKEPKIDPNMLIYDFEKMDNHKVSHFMYKVALEILHSNKDQDLSKLEQSLFQDYIKQLLPEDASEAQTTKYQKMCETFARLIDTQLPPLCAFLGGVVAQEIVKAITQKYMPINQLFYFDCLELVPAEGVPNLDPSQTADRYSGLKSILGDDLLQKIHNCKLFMIGAGAIGCELLKNYAMLGLGSGKNGQIILTDPDVIEVSNLNRQFLFREKHLRKPKSQTAAAAAIQMNPGLKGHVQARLDKIHDGTAHVYNEQFFKKQDIVTNALDNVAARLYIDGKCVAARTPLIDSGTLGPKGHVQIVLPGYKTESYASQADPEDNTEIPHCTLKMFPEETLHCIEWAKDVFGQQFTLKPQSYNKLLQQDYINFSDQQELTNLAKVTKFVEKKFQVKEFKDCVYLARKRFQKHFVNDIKQLLHVYPLDKQTKEGRPFWSLPKRPPHPVVFDPTNKVHQTFVAACACLYAKIFGVKITVDNERSDQGRKAIAQIAETFEMAEFVPNDFKATQISSQVEKEKAPDTEIVQEEKKIEEDHVAQDKEKIKQKYEQLIKPLTKDHVMPVEEFEKDNDQNYHIDFIYAMANIRAQNYGLEEMDWISVKIKAGRIVPALATTTAAIAGLQTLELLKYLKNCKLEEHRNSFMNLAVPSLMMSEPGPAPKSLLKEGLEVTLWDRWEYDATQEDNVTLLDVVSVMEKRSGLQSRDVFCNGVPVYLHALHGKDRKKHMGVPLLQKVQVKDKNVEFVDLVVTFVDESKDGSEKKIEGVPTVRVILKAE